MKTWSNERKWNDEKRKQLKQPSNPYKVEAINLENLTLNNNPLEYTHLLLAQIFQMELEVPLVCRYKGKGHRDCRITSKEKLMHNWELHSFWMMFV